MRYPDVQVQASSFLLILFQTGENKSLMLTFGCGSSAEKVMIDELNLGVFLVVVLNRFHATIFIIPHFV